VVTGASQQVAVPLGRLADALLCCGSGWPADGIR